MSRSILLQLARDSIEEVFQAQRTIDKTALLQTYPLLNENIPVTINLYREKELKGSYNTTQSSPLIDNIIIGAKKAAFEDTNTNILTTSEYLHCDIELILKTPEGEMSDTDPAIIT